MPHKRQYLLRLTNSLQDKNLIKAIGMLINPNFYCYSFLFFLKRTHHHTITQNRTPTLPHRTSSHHITCGQNTFMLFITLFIF